MKKVVSFKSCDGINTIHAVAWLPEGEPKGVLQIVHGMVEYIERYEEFAEYMNSQGFIVVGHDHLGHGESVQTEEDWGYIAEVNPSAKLVEDIRRVYVGAKKKFEGLPYFLLGHSMGSYLVRKYITVYGNDLTGIILTGTGTESKATTKVGLMVIRALTKKYGSRYRSDFVRELMYTSPYKLYDLNGIDPERGWITRDPEITKKYYSDPKCTFTFTLNGYEALVSTVDFVCDKKNIAKIPRKVPLLIASGDMDPVGNLGKGVKEFYNEVVKTGKMNVECKLFPEARHEILNEINREDVYAFLRDWMLNLL